MEIQKAVRATISLGDIELNGYQMPDGSYAMSQNGCKILDILIGDSTGKKYAKPLILKDNLCGELTKIEGQNAPARLMSLNTFSEIVGIYAQLGNKKCQAIIYACFSESLERRLDNAFNVKRTEDEYNQRLDARVKGKLARRTLTDCIQDYCENTKMSEKYKKFIFSNCSDYLNKIILGAKSTQAKKFYSVPENSLLRNHIPVNALRELELAENLAGRFIDERNLEPLDAVKEACGVAFVKFIGLE